MKFLIDAQLPKRLATLFTDAGHDTVHTLDLSLGNRTPDAKINQISLDQSRVVVTKDADFRDSFMVNGRPYKLLLVSTGNIPNSALLYLFQQNLDRIVTLFQTHSYIEIDRNHLTVHQ